MTQITRKDFGPFLRRLRTRQGLSQEKLAEIMGCNRIHIWRLEHGERHPSRVFLKSLSNLGLIRDAADQQLLRALEQVIEYHWDGDDIGGGNYH
jgi:transcriptional regulator with XRE-family HTH domain